MTQESTYEDMDTSGYTDESLTDQYANADEPIQTQGETEELVDVAADGGAFDSDEDIADEDGALEEPDEDGALEEPDDVGDEKEVSEDDVDAIADAAIEVLRDILSHFEADGAEINEYEGDDGELILDVVGGDLAILIGRRGRTLESLQTLVSSITHHKVGFRYPVTVDVESYKYRQRQKIEALATSAASRAYRQDRDVKLRPMNPYERRIVHIALRDDERVETLSEGVDPHRYVVVKPI